MGLIYTQLAADNFQRANENPLAPSRWTAPSDIPPLQIVNDECVCTDLTESNCIYTGITWPDNQWAQVQIDQVLAGDNAAALLVMRRQNDDTAGAVFEETGR